MWRNVGRNADSCARDSEGEIEEADVDDNTEASDASGTDVD